MKWVCTLGLMAVVGASGTAHAEPAHVDFEQKWIFPKSLGGLEYEISEKYESEDFGYRIIYRSGQSFMAEVTVYDLGQGSIPNGCKGEGIDLVLQTVEDGINLRLEHGEIEKLKKLRTGVTPEGDGLRFATIVFNYQNADSEGTKKTDATYVTGIRNQFVRLQFTFDQAKRGKATAMANEMMAQLSKTTTSRPEEEEIVMASCAVFLNDPASYGGLTAAQQLMAKAGTMGNLNVYTHLFVWPTSYYSKPKNADLLIAGYFAGMLQVVVPQKLDEGGEFEAFSAMLDTYTTLRSKDQIDEIEKIGEWAKNPDRRALYDQLLIAE